MSELIREALLGETGKAINAALLRQIEQMDKVTVAYVRNGDKTYSDIRYNQGISDGIRLALNTIQELGGKRQT